MNAKEHYRENQTSNNAVTEHESNSSKQKAAPREATKPSSKVTDRSTLSAIKKVFSKLMIRSQIKPTDNENKGPQSRIEVATTANDPQIELEQNRPATQDWRLDPPTKGPPSRITSEAIVKDNKSETWDQVLDDFFNEKWLKHFGLSPRQIVRETVPLKLDPKAKPSSNFNYEPLKEVKHIKSI